MGIAVDWPIQDEIRMGRADQRSLEACLQSLGADGVQIVVVILATHLSGIYSEYRIFMFISQGVNELE